MASEIFKQALRSHNWCSAYKLLCDNEDISEYLEENNFELYNLIIDGYKAHLDHIQHVNIQLMFELYPDVEAQEDFEKDYIVKLIELLMKRGFRLSRVIKDNITARDILARLSPGLHKHLTNVFKETNANGARLLAFIYAHTKNKQIGNLPTEITKNVATFLGYPVTKPNKIKF